MGTKQDGGQEFTRWKSERPSGESGKIIFDLTLSLKPYLVAHDYCVSFLYYLIMIKWIIVHFLCCWRSNYCKYIQHLEREIS